MTGFLGATALGFLAFKGFTTITNSGSELKDALVYTVVLGLLLTAFFDLTDR